MTSNAVAAGSVLLLKCSHGIEDDGLQYGLGWIASLRFILRIV